MNKNWKNYEIKELAKTLDVTFAKIYKWHWERNKKEKKGNMALKRLYFLTHSKNQTHQKSHEDSDFTLHKMDKNLN